MLDVVLEVLEVRELHGQDGREETRQGTAKAPEVGDLHQQLAAEPEGAGQQEGAGLAQVEGQVVLRLPVADVEVVAPPAELGDDHRDRHHPGHDGEGGGREPASHEDHDDDQQGYDQDRQQPVGGGHPAHPDEAHPSTLAMGLGALPAVHRRPI